MIRFACLTVLISAEVSLVAAENLAVNFTESSVKIADNSQLFKGPCSDVNFRCFNGRCIPNEWLCDGSQDCPDGEDEHDFSCMNNDHGRCEAHKVECLAENGKRKCIPEEWKCDGHADCADGSDEVNCPKASSTIGDASNSPPPNRNILYPFSAKATNCRNFEFMCANTKCIDREFLCDGVNNCGDGSDESFTNCAIPPVDAPPKASTSTTKADSSLSTSTLPTTKKAVTTIHRTETTTAVEKSTPGTVPTTSWSTSTSTSTTTLLKTSSTQPITETSSYSTTDHQFSPKFVTSKLTLARDHVLDDDQSLEGLQPITAFVSQPIVPVIAEQNLTTSVYYVPPIAGNQTEIIEEARRPKGPLTFVSPKY